MRSITALLFFATVSMLAACGTRSADPLANRCNGQFDIAVREHEAASARWARGRPDLTRAANLIRLAHRQRKQADYSGCVESVRQARAILRSLVWPT